MQDLLRVISHHRARLATPVRTVQNIYGNVGIDNIPCAETVFTRAGAPDRPFLLDVQVEPSSGIDADEKAKPHGTVQPIKDHITKPKASANRLNEDHQVASSSHSVTKSGDQKSVDVSESVNEKLEGKLSATAKPSFEDNIVLGVALEGSKRTLPIEEVREQSPAAIEAQEVGATSSSSSSSSALKEKNSESAK